MDNSASIDISTEQLHPLAGRSEAFEIETMHDLVESASHIKSVIDAMPFAIVVLDSHRQIIAANEELLKMLEVKIDQILGKRPGEVVGCVHANDGPDGCGTGLYCKVCGALNAILHCQHTSARQTEECRITLKGCQALDWKVTVSPLTIHAQEFMLATIQDISDQKRRDALERIFFHDIINHIGAIIGFAQMMAEEYAENPELTEVIQLANELLDEVQSQHHLTHAERGDLELSTEDVELQSFLQRLVQLYQNHPVAKHRNLVLDVPMEVMVETDVRLLKRIIGNMIKNALEASEEGQNITVSCEKTSEGVMVGVHNPAVIPESVKLQIFNRSFSTKADTGRGLGTYSMKLLGETYLGGKVAFTSDSDSGTLFTLTLPAAPNPGR